VPQNGQRRCAHWHPHRAPHAATLHTARCALPASCALRRGSLAENASTVKHKCTQRTNQEGRGAGIKRTNRYHQRTSAAARIRPYLESVDRQKGLKWQTVQRVDTPDNRPYYACPASNRFIARYLYLLFLLNATGSLRKCGPPRNPSPFGRPECGPGERLAMAYGLSACSSVCVVCPALPMPWSSARERSTLGLDSAAH